MGEVAQIDQSLWVYRRDGGSIPSLPTIEIWFDSNKQFNGKTRVEPICWFDSNLIPSGFGSLKVKRGHMGKQLNGRVCKYWKQIIPFEWRCNQLLRFCEKKRYRFESCFPRKINQLRGFVTCDTITPFAEIKILCNVEF